MSNPALLKLLRGESRLSSARHDVNGALPVQRFSGEREVHEFASKRRKVQPTVVERPRPGITDDIKPDFSLRDNREEAPKYTFAGEEGSEASDYHFASSSMAGGDAGAPEGSSGSSDGHGGGMMDGVKGVVNEINKRKVQTQDYKDNTWGEKEKRKDKGNAL